MVYGRRDIIGLLFRRQVFPNVDKRVTRGDADQDRHLQKYFGHDEDCANTADFGERVISCAGNVLRGGRRTDYRRQRNFCANVRDKFCRPNSGDFNHRVIADEIARSADDDGEHFSERGGCNFYSRLDLRGAVENFGAWLLSRRRGACKDFEWRRNNFYVKRRGYRGHFELLRGDFSSDGLFKSARKFDDCHWEKIFGVREHFDCGDYNEHDFLQPNAGDNVDAPTLQKSRAAPRSFSDSHRKFRGSRLAADTLGDSGRRSLDDNLRAANFNPCRVLLVLNSALFFGVNSQVIVNCLRL